jgi:hypothetical protein
VTDDLRVDFPLTWLQRFGVRTFYGVMKLLFPPGEYKLIVKKDSIMITHLDD